MQRKNIKIKEIAKSNNINFIVLTIESEGTKNSKKNEEILSQKYGIENIGVLNDSYGANMRKKYKAFLTDISHVEYSFDLSKIILYNKIGEIIYVSKISDEIDELGRYLTL